MKIYLYFQPWKEETWDSQNKLTSKKSNIWDAEIHKLRDIEPVNSWKSDQRGSEYQILPFTRMNVHIYMKKHTWMSIHTCITHTYSHENMKTTKIKLLHYHASELSLHKWKDINQQLTHWPAHVFTLTSHSITHYSLWNLSRYLTKGKWMQTVW